MSITLICKYDNASAAFAASMINAVRASVRQYQAVGGEMLLDGYPDVVLHYDADYLLSIPGGLYRMLTPAEQDAKAEAARKAATVEEVASVVEAEKPAAPKKVSG